MNHFKITIPVKTYVRKYLEARYPQPMLLSVKNLMGTVVYAFLEKEKIKNHTKKNDYYTSLKYDDLTDSIQVLVPRTEVMQYRQGISLCKLKAIIINNFFEQKINEELNVYCRSYTLAGFSNRRAIEDFATHHNIHLETDISFDAFKKSEYRHRKRLEKNTPKLSRDFY